MLASKVDSQWIIKPLEIAETPVDSYIKDVKRYKKFVDKRYFLYFIFYRYVNCVSLFEFQKSTPQFRFNEREIQTIAIQIVRGLYDIA